MAPVSSADGGDRRRVARRCKPVVHGCPDLAPLDRRLAGSMMAGDQQQHPIAASERLLEAAVDRRPGRIQAHPVEVEYAIGLNAPAAEAPVPAAIEGPVGDRHRFRPGWPTCQRGSHQRRRTDCPRRISAFRASLLSRQRPNCGRDTGPQLGFFRAEGTHGRQRPSGPGSALDRWPTCRRRSPPPRRRTPKRYRTGSVP